jgi:hypothetical protein
MTLVTVEGCWEVGDNQGRISVGLEETSWESWGESSLQPFLCLPG